MPRLLRCCCADAPAPAANAARSSRARGSRSGASGHTTPAGSDRTDERFFLRHNSAKGVRPFKLTDDMKSIIFGGASALPDWVSQDNNERGSHYRASRPSRNQTEPDTRGVNVSPTPTDAQVGPQKRKPSRPDEFLGRRPRWAPHAPFSVLRYTACACGKSWVQMIPYLRLLRPVCI